jgi:large subunit ribosomal protein L6
MLARTFEAAAQGLTRGVVRELELVGVGYRAKVSTGKTQTLTLKLGLSHDATYTLPMSVRAQCTDPTHITLVGVDVPEVSGVAADLCALRRIDPYKGKGVRMVGVHYTLKEGKKK